MIRKELFVLVIAAALYVPAAARSADAVASVSAVAGATAQPSTVITMQIDPNTAEGQFEWGKKALEVREDIKAQECFEKATQLKPTWAEAWAYYGAARGRTNHVDDELEYCKKAAEMKPKSAEIRFLLGMAWVDQGKDGKAEDAFLEAIALEPRFALSHYRLGLVYNSNENWKKALKELQAFVALQPTGPEAENAQAMIGRIKLALDH